MELVFCSWCADILVHIQDCKLDNKVAIQLIKDQTQNSACHEVEFKLNLCGGEIQYQDLLEHLSIALQGGYDEANILAEFYSHNQKLQEMEKAFADELQLLACKVISKKPDFRNNLDTTLKQHYTNQIYDHNSASITKMMLIQMPRVTFRNELARVLGTHQRSKGSTKMVSVSSIHAKSWGGSDTIC